MPDTGTALALQDDKTLAREIAEYEWSISVSSHAANYHKHMEGWQSFNYPSSEHILPELFKPVISIATAEWYAECAVSGAALIHDCIDINPRVRGGRPVLKGTGFTVSSALAELAETGAVNEVADRFSLNVQTIRDLLSGLSLMFERPFKP